ncbi:MAG: DUF1727 domain-containing protein [Oscillospiraceae bacterium]|nr:DUF1727 domain-containing protein [Oscillospiraceae bacterium]
MSLRTICAVALCKALHFVARVLKRGGTAMPGRWALRVCPSLPATLAKGVNILVITGTNGKTTSSRIAEEAFRAAGYDVLANRSGANLLSGITTELALHSTLTGRCRKQWAVIECDEAAARRALGLLKPKVILVTNLFRDQLDRYGEVTHTLENIREGIKGAPDALLCLNADCSLTSSLALDTPNPVRWYGLDAGAADPAPEPPRLSDASHCIRCKTEYEYDYVTYGHLGGFRCPKCGYARHAADVAVSKIVSMDPDGSTVELREGGERKSARVNLPAAYNVYNAAGAYAAVRAMGLPAGAALEALGSFQCGFGRMERFDLGAAGTRVMLVKNPAGCDQVLRFLGTASGPMELVMLLNDNAADGTDVSWIWDAEFEVLAARPELLTRVSLGGMRAWDLYLRLKYAGVPTEKLEVERDGERLAGRIAAAAVPVYVMPTYTALLEFRPHLLKRCGGADFWEG